MYVRVATNNSNGCDYGFEVAPMTREEIETLVAAHPGRRFRVTFAGGVTEALYIGPIDDEGFMNSGPGSNEPDLCWTRFDSVSKIELDDQT
jgi:hypothetical protein